MEPNQGEAEWADRYFQLEISTSPLEISLKIKKFLFTISILVKILFTFYIND